MFNNDPSFVSAQETPITVAGLWARGLATRRCDLLGDLAEQGLEAARALTRQLRASADIAEGAAARGEAAPALPSLAADPGLTYSRISRAVRLTLALQQKMVDATRSADKALGRRTDIQDHDERADKSHRVARLLRRVLEAQGEEGGDEDDASEAAKDPERVSRLVTDAWERLEDEDRWGHLLDRPVGEILAQIAKDLGLSPDYRRWISEAWAGDAIAAFEGEKSLIILGRDRRRSRQGGASDYAAETPDGPGAPSGSPSTPADDPEPP